MLNSPSIPVFHSLFNDWSCMIMFPSFVGLYTDNYTVKLATSYPYGLALRDTK